MCLLFPPKINIKSTTRPLSRELRRSSAFLCLAWLEGNEREVHCLRPYSSAGCKQSLSFLFSLSFSRALANVGLGRLTGTRHAISILDLRRSATRFVIARRILSRDVTREPVGLIQAVQYRDAIFKSDERETAVSVARHATCILDGFLK